MALCCATARVLSIFELYVTKPIHPSPPKRGFICIMQGARGVGQQAQDRGLTSLEFGWLDCCNRALRPRGSRFLRREPLLTPHRSSCLTQPSQVPQSSRTAESRPSNWEDLKDKAVNSCLSQRPSKVLLYESVQVLRDARPF